MVAVIAHRGASGSAPENTMAAFERAMDMGADGIELDCQLTRDGRLVVIHDSSLERTTGVAGFVKDIDWEQLRRLDAGSWFGPEFQGEGIPLLADVLRLVRDRCLLNIEIKNLPFRGVGVEAALVQLLKETRFPLEQVIVSSFDHVSLMTVAELEPALSLAALFAHYPLSFSDLPGTIVHPHREVVNSDFVQEARTAGKSINVWTVNDPAGWHYLIDLGVDGIVTDRPDKLRRWLDTRADAG